VAKRKICASDEQVVALAQKRLKSRIDKFGSIRRYATHLGINHYYVSSALAGNAPHNLELRKLLGYPAVMPSEKRTIVRTPPPRLGSEAWTKLAFKKPRPQNNKR
jgi:hypothetical protein